MNFPRQIAQHIRAVYFGGNWTAVNLKETLADVDWKEATKVVDSLNTIAALVFHMNYYVIAGLRVLRGHELDAHDKFSFNVPLIQSQREWDTLVQETWNEVESFASLVEQFPEENLDKVFVSEDYGNYYRNFHGVIEHTHYHLGQIVLLKKLIRSTQTMHNASL